MKTLKISFVSFFAIALLAITPVAFATSASAATPTHKTGVHHAKKHAPHHKVATKKPLKKHAKHA